MQVPARSFSNGFISNKPAQSLPHHEYQLRQEGRTGADTPSEDLFEVCSLTPCGQVWAALPVALSLSSHPNTSTYKKRPD